MNIENAQKRDSEETMAGKVCLVTGSTSGIGTVTALALARRRATVGVVGRNADRTFAVAQRLQQESGNPAVIPFSADLSVQAEVRRLAAEVEARFPRLDVLVNNAGAMFLARQESRDEIEMTLALNHLAYFLLTNLLLERLRAAPAARVISVASDAHRWSWGIDFDDLQGRHRYGGFRAYAQSKLANVLFSAELARRLAGTTVTANALHPGFVATGFFSGTGMNRPLGRLMQLSARLFAIGPEDGAAMSIYLATAAAAGGSTGQYFENRKPVPPSRAARDEAAARRLWKVSAELTGLDGGPGPGA
jgi:NAD(P)-dependent dehydrogenase (short-subunit alcohol dehydrogenase family)